MSDLILDTNVLGEFFEQYFDVSLGNRGCGTFVAGDFLSVNAAREINRIVMSFQRHDDIAAGIVVISSFAFVELFRKWDQITNGRIDLNRLRGFLKQPPVWVNIAPLDESLAPFFIQVPISVFTDNGFKSIEWTDCVHVATALARGDGHVIATTDSIMRQMNLTSRVKCI